jgi:hypothetical protein
MQGPRQVCPNLSSLAPCHPCFVHFLCGNFGALALSVSAARHHDNAAEALAKTNCCLSICCREILRTARVLRRGSAFLIAPVRTF